MVKSTLIYKILRKYIHIKELMVKLQVDSKGEVKVNLHIA